MAGETHEQTINTAMGEILSSLVQSWNVRAEQIGKVFEDGGRPDILIEEPGGWPVVIEAEVGNHRQAENDAQARLGTYLVDSPKTIDSAVALVYSDSLRKHDGQALRDAIRKAEFEYAVFSREADIKSKRFPTSGWLSGGVNELAMLVRRVSVPTSRVEALADVLETGISRAEGAFSSEHPTGSPLGEYGISYTYKGRRYREIAGSTKTAARSALEARRGEIRQDRFNIPTKKRVPRFRDFADEYMDNARLNKRSWRRDKCCMERFNTAFGKYHLDEITPRQIERYKMARSRDCVPYTKREITRRTVNIELTLLKRMFNLAVKWGYIEANPMQHVEVFRLTEKKRRILTPEEQKKLLAVAPPHLGRSRIDPAHADPSSWNCPYLRAPSIIV